MRLVKDYGYGVHIWQAGTCYFVYGTSADMVFPLAFSSLDRAQRSANNAMIEIMKERR